MVIRWGRYGEYLACTNEQCKARKPLEKSLGVICPACKQGQIVERKVRKGKMRGKVFYGCNRYPDCQFMLWDKPVGRLCPKCGSLLVEKQNGRKHVTVACSNKECDYREEAGSAQAMAS